jgi:hypothetical protein
MNHLQDRLLQILKTPLKWDMANARSGSSERHRHPFDWLLVRWLLVGSAGETANRSFKILNRFDRSYNFINEFFYWTDELQNSSASITQIYGFSYSTL